MRGDLMVAKRHNFQRIYDLRERILPDGDDSRIPSLETVHETFVLNTVKAPGVTKAAWRNTPQVIVRYATEPGLAERLSGE